MIPQWKIYPRSQGHSTVYLQNAVNDPSISVGEYTVYDDFVHDPRDFQRNNVLYRLIIFSHLASLCLFHVPNKLFEINVSVSKIPKIVSLILDWNTATFA